MAGAFSLLGPMRTTPYAIGERGPNSTVPLIGDLSGQDAVDSLVGYYSMKRQDSRLGANRPMQSGPRKTNYPNTKVANLRDAAMQERASAALQSLDVDQSQFVAGFLSRCKEAGVRDAQHVFSVIQQAMDAHQAVAEEFVKCGMVKVAMYGPSFHPPSDYKFTAKKPSPKKVDISYDQGLDIGSASPTAENFAASQAKMRLPTKPIKAIPGLGTPALDTMASQAPQYDRPQPAAPSGTPPRRPQLRPTPLAAPEISTVPRSQWTQEQVQQWQKKRAEGGYSEHPYFRSHDLSGAWTRKMPERIGDFRTDEQGFSEDLAQYVSRFTPDAKKRFAAIVEKSGMQPEAILRARQSQQELTGKMPMMDTATRQAAKQLYDRGERQDAPVSPDYNEIMKNYYELAPKWREDMLRWQQYEQSRWPRHGPNAPEPPGTWIFPPRSEFAHEGWGPANTPRMLEHTKYQGLPQYMQTFTEPKSKDLAAYWKQQMARANDPKRSGEHVAPQNYARAYSSDRQRRMDQQEFERSEPGLPMRTLQRTVGFRRDDPSGKEVFTTKGIGRHPGGLAGAIKDTIAGSMFMPFAALTSLGLGKKDIAAMSARDVFSLLNYLADIDVGWEANVKAEPPGFGETGPGREIAIGRGMNTTTGFFSSKIDPTTGTYKPSGTEDLRRLYESKANDPEAGGLSRIGNKGAAGFIGKSGDLLAALGLMRGAGANPAMGQVMRQLSLTGAASEAVPTLLDPYRSYYNPATKDTPAAGSVGPRLKETVGRGAQGYLLPYTANPVYSMAGQALQEAPGLNKYYKAPDRLRLATMGKGSVPSMLGEGAATAMEWAPSLMLYGRGAVSPKYLGLAGLSGAMNAPSSADSPKAEAIRKAYREMVQKRYDMPREDFMRWQDQQSRVDGMMRDLQRGIKPDPAVLSKALSGATPKQVTDIQALVKGKPAAKAPPKPQAPQKFDPGAIDAPEGMSAEQATAARYEAIDAIWEAMPPQQQQAWSNRHQELEQGFFQSYSQMAEAQGQSPDRIRQVAKADAQKQWMTEFNAAQQVQLQAQPAIGGQ